MKHAILALLLCSVFAAQLRSITFDVEFTSGGSQIGSGWIIVDPDPGNTPTSIPYDFTTMDFSFTFFDYGTFTEANILNVDSISIVPDLAGIRYLEFEGDSGATFGGSLSLTNDTYYISFEGSNRDVPSDPSDPFGNRRTFTISIQALEEGEFGEGILGEYRARAVPEAGSTGLLLAITIPLLSFVRKRH